MSAAAAARIDGVARRRRAVLVFLTLLAVGGSLALGMLKPRGGNTLGLELARTAGEFRAALESWRQPGDCGNASPADPRCSSVVLLQYNLFVDSVVFVPGYVGLLVLFLTVLGREAHPLRSTLIQALCIVPIAAGFFDIAENGMTARAAADELERVLADGTVLDVREATLIKWILVAASLALIGYHAAFVAYRQRSMARVPRVLLAAGALLATIGALLLLVGALVDQRWIPFGYVVVMPALALVAWQGSALWFRRAYAPS